MKKWHDDDRFWKAWRPMMFTPARWDAVPAEVDAMLKLLKIKPGSRILDLCCGPGRHSLELARRGFVVTGVDRTRSYLGDARRLARKEKLDVEFLLADMRRFRRPREFDAVINMFTAFGYFRKQADDVRVAKNMAASLKPGGVLLMELMSKEICARIFRARDWHETPDGMLVLEERKVKSGWDWVDNRWILIRGGRRRVFHVSHRLYSAAELGTLLKQAGFARVKSFGGLDGKPYDHDAQRMVLVARK